jgi:hypothetical protein
VEVFSIVEEAEGRYDRAVAAPAVFLKSMGLKSTWAVVTSLAGAAPVVGVRIFRIIGIS